MLEGREPASRKDWQLVLNFVAANAASGLETPICNIFNTLYATPLTRKEVTQIAEFQAARKSYLVNNKE